MPSISFNAAKDMVTSGEDWLKNVSDLIKGTAIQNPTDIYPTQKLAFELSKTELLTLMDADKLIGIFGYEPEANSLCFVVVGLNSDGRPYSPSLLPCQTWPITKGMKDINDVLNVYLEP